MKKQPTFVDRLSPGQHDLWLEQNLYPADISNHFHFNAKLKGIFDLNALQKAIRRLAAHHEVIRTIVDSDHDALIRKILSPKAVSLTIETCQQLSHDQFLDLIHENYKIPFDLSKDVPYRFRLYQRSEQEFYLQIVIHHIAATLKEYVQIPVDLAKLYIAEKDEKKGSPSNAIPYSQFVQKYHDYLMSDDVEVDKQFWLKYLEGSMPSPLLPVCHSFHAHGFQGKVKIRDLSGDISSKLKEISVSNDSTFFSLMTGAFQLLVSRYTKQEEVIVGIPTDAMRNLGPKEDSNKFCGYTINTLPLRTKLNAEQSFCEFVQGIGKDIRNISKHRLYPLSKAQQGLYKILVISQKSDAFSLFGIGKKGIEIDVEGIKYESIGIGHLPTGRFDLALAIVEVANQVTVAMHYNSLIFTELEIENLFNHYFELLKNVVNDPAEKISRLSILSKKEKNEQLHVWNATAREESAESSFLELFQEQAAKFPKSTAVIFNGKKLDYERLNHAANQLARYLIKMGATESSLIGIGMQRSPEVIISLLGVLKAGAAYLPLDPENPKDRIEHILNDSQTDILITEKSLQNTFPSYFGRCVYIDEALDVISNEEAKNLNMVSNSNQLAYVIYTSGSTGKPKGVEILRKALDNFLISMQRKLALSTNDRCLAVTTISFDISILEILLPLSQGATIILADRETVKDPSLLAKAIEKNQITIAQATPSLWQTLVDCGWKGSSELTILCGGEALSETLAQKLVKESKILWNMYGPTETTIWSSMKKIGDVHEKISIGRPIANTTFYILDEYRQIQPVGVTGELYIGGAGLAKGYRNNEALTNQSFIHTPVDGAKCLRLYKTGDLARFMPNGEVECLGRLDQQVKIRGYRIELGEIEEALRQCEGIQQAAVLVRERQVGDKRIIAYCTGSYEEARVVKTLRSLLPHYMIPSAYVHLDEIPLTPNGKLNRLALPLPTQTSNPLDSITPETPVQKEIIKILESLLEVEKIGLHSNFFSLGVQSLLAARAVVQLNRLFHIHLPLNTLLEQSTPYLLAQAIEIALRENPTPSIQEDAKIYRSILSPAQLRFWFLEHQTENIGAYGIPFILEFNGDLDRTALELALNAIVAKHAILRTVFRDTAQGPEQFVSLYIQSSIQYSESIDSMDFLSSESKKPFDLTSGPLFRFHLIKSDVNKHLLFLNFHHIVFDGYSVLVFVNEFKRFYGLYKNGCVASEHQEIQYVDYAHMKYSSLGKTAEEKQKAWWLEKLQDAPTTLNLPTDKPRPPIQTYHGAQLEFTLLNRKQLKELKNLSRECDATLFMTLLTAFHILVYRYTGQNDVVIGVPVSGRNHGDCEPLIGCFTNILALRTTSNSRDSFVEFLKWIKEACLGAFQNQDIPFEKVIEHLKIDRSSSHPLLYQVMFNLLPSMEIDKIEDLSVTLKQVDRQIAHLDFTLSVQENQEELTGIFEYNTDLFFRETIQRMVEHFQNLLKSIIKMPKKNIGKLELLSHSEMDRQLIQWNEPSIAYPKNQSIVELIEKWADETPDVVALVSKGKTYSYAQLNHQANSIANTLLKQGIKQEDKIAVCLERSAEFIPVILGILKAGGVYIPIDPKTSIERIESILHEIQPFRLVIDQTLEAKLSGFEMLSIHDLKGSELRNPSLLIPDHQLAYMIYTSGSSGKPKGVEIEHRSINDRVLWKNATYPLSHADAMLHTYSFIFDGAIINYFWPLCAGASLIIATEEELLEPEALIGLIQKHKVTTMDLLPSLLQGLMREKQFSDCHSLKYVFSGGEALSGVLIPLFYQKCKAKLYNTYGPTEATVEASVWECDPDDAGTIAPIGRPIAGAKLYILDVDQNIVPIGVPGELHIGGTGLARQYFNAPSITEEKFISNPFCNSNEGRLYRTGDLVRYRKDGNIEFLGRIDNQVKIRGYRIDISAVEEALQEMHSVEKAVIVVKGQDLNRHLVAYVTLNCTDRPDQFGQIMRDSLKSIFPKYMIPQNVVILDRFPTLLNGKINLKGLPEPILEGQQSGCSSRKKKLNPLESELLSIWKEVLGYEELAVTDNFFEIGGNSLLAMRLMANIKHNLKIRIPLIHLFQNPTIEQFAESIGITEAKAFFSPIILMKEGGDKRPFFCVHPVGGNILCYRALAESWTNERSFYAIQAKGIEEDEIPHESIEKMASEYIQALRKIQPSGPYLLGGWSFGGLIAAEMTHQMKKQGEEVELLVLIDTTANIEKFQNINIEDESILLSELTHHYIGKPSARQKNSPISFRDQFIGFMENGGKGPIKHHHTNDSVDRLINLAKANYRALQGFSMPSLDARVVLLRTEENLEHSKCLGWQKYAKNLNIIDAPGDHWGITKQDLAHHYAKLLQSCFKF